MPGRSEEGECACATWQILPFTVRRSAARTWARMRDDDVGAGLRAWVGGRQLSGAGVHEGGRGGRLAGGQPGGQQRADDARQHVARSRGGGPRLARRVEVNRSTGFSDDRHVTLQQHRGAEPFGELAGRGDAVVTGRSTGQSCEFTRMRRQYGRRPTTGDQIGMSGEDGQRVGVDDRPAGRSQARTTALPLPCRRCRGRDRPPRPARDPMRRHSALR